MILDVRGNGGGYVNFGERILQTLSPRPITPEPFHFVSTPFTLSIAEDGRLADRVGRSRSPPSLATGAGFSQGFPVTDPRELQHDHGQRYHGPVVLLVDALCYSTTDIFAAGFQDHHIGKVIGLDAAPRERAGRTSGTTPGSQQLSVTPNPFKELPRRR